MVKHYPTPAQVNYMEKLTAQSLVRSLLSLLMLDIPLWKLSILMCLLSLKAVQQDSHSLQKKVWITILLQHLNQHLHHTLAQYLHH